MEGNTKVKWGNQIAYVLIPFNISIPKDPLDYVRQAKSVIDVKKHSLDAIATYSIGKFFLDFFGVKVIKISEFLSNLDVQKCDTFSFFHYQKKKQLAAGLMYRVLLNTTMSFSNVVGPAEAISFYGNPLTFIAPTVCGHPHVSLDPNQYRMLHFAIS